MLNKYLSQKINEEKLIDLKRNVTEEECKTISSIQFFYILLYACYIYSCKMSRIVTFIPCRKLSYYCSIYNIFYVFW